MADQLCMERPRKAAVLSIKELRQEVVKISNVDPPVSLAMAARALGTPARDLYRRYPGPSKVISACFRGW